MTCRISRAAVLSLAIGVAGIVTTFQAVAQAWPSKPVRIVAGFGAGGAGDTIARAIAEGLSGGLGQPVIVENRPGGGAAGVLSVTLVSQAAPDGYTLGIGTSGPFGAGPAVSEMPWDPVGGFTHISLVSESPYFIVSSSALPAASLPEVIKLIRANPGKYNYGSDGVGSTAHLAFELLKLREKLFVVHIPYVTTPERLRALLASEVQMGIYGPSAAVANLGKEGKLRVLAVTAPKRLETFPDVPTAGELGLPGFDVSSWVSVFGPAGLPKDILARLNREVASTLQRPEVRSRIFASGQFVIRSTSPEELTSFIATQIKQWKDVVRQAGIKVQ